MAKPILFNTDMVRAILDGKKTVTRRIVKPHNLKIAKKLGYCQNSGLWISFDKDNPDECEHVKDYSVSPCWVSFEWYMNNFAPYKKGDILYVRETWCKGRLNAEKERFFYRADKAGFLCKWLPSLHMPKEAARIFLKVTDVRIERLQDITEEQAVKEGFSGIFAGSGEAMGSGWDITPQDEFAALWNKTVKKYDVASCGWEANPYVWVIEFERCRKPKDF